NASVCGRFRSFSGRLCAGLFERIRAVLPAGPEVMRARCLQRHFFLKEALVAAKIPLSRVYQSEKIDRRILDVVHGGNYILGPESKAFEQELAASFGVKHVVLSSSWTAAVHLLHIAQGLKPGDEVLVPSLTAFPSIEPMIHVGAKPI